MSSRPSSRAHERRARLLAGIAVLALVVAPSASACTRGTSSSSGTGTAPSGAGSSSASAPPGSAATTTPASTEPGILAVTKAGALVRLDPATGAIRETLVASGVAAGQVAAGPDGTVYYATGSGCAGTIEALPPGGGAPKAITSGWEPAVSPDGTKLAYADAPGADQSCPGWSTGTPGTTFRLGIYPLGGGATSRTIPQLPPSQQGLPAPISHLSWSPDGQRLAVSIASVQDNEGWGVNLVDAATAQSYADGPGVTSVPVTGDPTPQQSYLREGVYMPSGNLFVSRACCGGFPPRNTSRLMWEVTPDGTMTHQVAIGFATIDHVSLDVSRDGQWLLYLGGNNLYVSQGGARPSQVASGLVAASWG